MPIQCFKISLTMCAIANIAVFRVKTPIARILRRTNQVYVLLAPFAHVRGVFKSSKFEWKLFTY